MTESIIVALITGAVAMIGSLISAASQSKLTAYRLDELKRDFADLKTRVDKHNNLVERMAVAEHEIDQLKGGH